MPSSNYVVQCDWYNADEATTTTDGGWNYRWVPGQFQTTTVTITYRYGEDTMGDVTVHAVVPRAVAYVDAVIDDNPPRAPLYGTPEEARKIRERAREIIRQREERERAARASAEREFKQAERRARRLLLQNLTQEQRDSVARDGTIRIRTIICSAASAVRVRIDPGPVDVLIATRMGIAGNVFVLDEAGNPVRRFCAHPAEDELDAQLPEDDVFLAQKLWIEADPDAFFQAARAHPLCRVNDPSFQAILPPA